IFDDKQLKLVFIKDSYEFLIKLGDDRELTFDILPDGFSAFLSILMDLFVRLDLIRKVVGNNSYNPYGIVLIDEPETHLHISLQYHVLPILTTLFPNVQFIVATHSPAVVASIKKVTVFDVATKDTRTDEVVGRSYSELMTSHFGLENDYSSEADKIIKQINEAVEQFNDDPEQLRDSLQQLSVENAHYLSPSLKIELELLLAQSEARFAAHQ
ncbi:MAG: AAA family ATPase, partial [Rudanella sp.]|nr:AAA family ATPase [Rudanella sp.]